jgi:hypothetical protein
MLDDMLSSLSINSTDGVRGNGDKLPVFDDDVSPLVAVVDRILLVFVVVGGLGGDDDEKEDDESS